MLNLGQVQIKKSCDEDGRTDCFQRAGGWCESAEKRECSTFQAADESRKGKPFIAVQEVRRMLRAIWVATRVNVPSQTIIVLGRDFFISKKGEKIYEFCRNNFSY